MLKITHKLHLLLTHGLCSLQITWRHLSHRSQLTCPHQLREKGQSPWVGGVGGLNSHSFTCTLYLYILSCHAQTSASKVTRVIIGNMLIIWPIYAHCCGLVPAIVCFEAEQKESMEMQIICGVESKHSGT